MPQGNVQATILGGPAHDWTPDYIGDGELDRLLRKKLPNDTPAQHAVRSATLRILSRCINPRDQNAASNTGLVIGYVQSGKTMSFTAVAAAAHDNGFRCVAIIAGSSLNLADQNKDRIAQDLDIGTSPFRPWYRMHNPTRTDLDQLRTALHGWEAGRSGKTLLLTSLKHQRRVQHLGQVLEELGDLGAPALIIDDEADQISLNTRVNQGDESPNYSKILGLRDRTRRHTYLQYTATPQANIFIPLWDRLSPEFCEVLEPGQGYVGGHRIFVDRGNDLVRVISSDDLNRADALTDRPESLSNALQAFFLGVAQGLSKYEDSGVEPWPKNRSMMVHPARLQHSHRVFAYWVRASRDSWRRQLQDTNDPDYLPLVTEFRAAYEDLRRTDRTQSLEPFERLLRTLPTAIAQTQVREENARPGGDETDWPRAWGTAYSWILVGGQNLDRGFTVEGLTVTYMPRDVGTGQADTIQQRARFFGYKSGYEDLCRVYLGADSRQAFEVYVRHERSMRGFLERHKERLDDPAIPREFELDPQLRPTRRQVLLQAPDRFVLRQGWLPQQSPLDHVSRCRQNGELVRAFAEARGASVSDAVPWVHDASAIRDDHRHRVSHGIALRAIYENLLVSLVLPDPDEHTRWQVAMTMIDSALMEHGDLEASIVLMRPSSTPFRGLDDVGRIKQVFAGAFPGQQPYAYAGDRDVRLGDVTLQLHSFDVGQGADAETSQGRQVQEARLPIVALWLGDRVNRPMIRQQQAQP